MHLLERPFGVMVSFFIGYEKCAFISCSTLLYSARFTPSPYAFNILADVWWRMLGSGKSPPWREDVEGKCQFEWEISLFFPTLTKTFVWIKHCNPLVACFRDTKTGEMV